MSKAYSMDLRERVVAAVKVAGMSRRQAVLRFGVGPSTAIKWIERFEEAGSVAPGQIGGFKPRTIRDGHVDWLRVRCREKPFTLRGLVCELASERGFSVDYRSVWQFVHDEKLSHKKDVDRRRTGSAGCRATAQPMDQIPGSG